MPNSTPTGATAKAFSPGATRAIIFVMYAGVTLAFLLTTFALFAAPQLAIVGAILWSISCFPWIALRTSIDKRDSAPLSSLDEYEAEVLDRWRRRAFKLSSFTMFTLAFLLIFGSVLASDGLLESISTFQIAYFVGIFCLTAYLLTASLLSLIHI